MNNKGQVLVVFIIFLPVIALLIGFIYDVGTISYRKKEAKDSITDAINYGLKNINDEDISKNIDYIISANIKNIQNKNIDIENGVIKIEVIFKIDGNFKRLFDNSIYTVDLKLLGYLENERIKIREW